MEMLAIFFAISDNLKAFKKIKRTRQIVIIRSDSRSTIEQLNNKAQITDNMIQRIYESIKRILQKICFIIVFDHLKRTKNRAGRILEKICRKNYKIYKKKHNEVKKIERQYLYIKYRDSDLEHENRFTYLTNPMLMH